MAVLRQGSYPLHRHRGSAPSAPARDDRPVEPPAEVAGLPGAAHAGGCRAARPDPAVRRGAPAHRGRPAAARRGRPGPRGRRAHPGPAAGPGPDQARERRPTGCGSPPTAWSRPPARRSRPATPSGSRRSDPQRLVGPVLRDRRRPGARWPGWPTAAVGVDRDPLTAEVAAANAAAAGVGDRVEVRCEDVTATDLAGRGRRVRRPGPAQQHRPGAGPALVVAAVLVRARAGRPGAGDRGQARARRPARGAAAGRRGRVGLGRRRRGRVRAVVRAAGDCRRTTARHPAALRRDADRRRHPHRHGRAGRPLPGGAGRRGDPGRAGGGGGRPGRRPAARPDDRLPDLRPPARDAVRHGVRGDRRAAVRPQAAAHLPARPRGRPADREEARDGGAAGGAAQAAAAARRRRRRRSCSPGSPASSRCWSSTPLSSPDRQASTATTKPA